MAALPGFKLNGPTGGSFTTSGSIHTGLPTNVSANDIILLHVTINNANPTITWPAGFSGIIQAAQTTDYYYGMAIKRADGTEASTFVQATFSVNSTGTSRSSSFSGVTPTGTPYENFVSGAGTSTSVTMPAHNTSGTDRYSLEGGGMRRNVNTAPTAPWVELQDAGVTNARYFTAGVFTSTATAYGTTSKTITSSDWITWRLSFLPDTTTTGFARSFCVMA